ncbi:MAG: hypothetical protein A2451_05545 [Bdellovibrionales bacterium RIFOXYC2_FULL_39_8]|nr:MAG: hypothetical protein A2451_05545 [Bdellovibrionales bacterium RIFOXYC2_FULL_39_8]
MDELSISNVSDFLELYHRLDRIDGSDGIVLNFRKLGTVTMDEIVIIKKYLSLMAESKGQVSASHVGFSFLEKYNLLDFSALDSSFVIKSFYIPYCCNKCSKISERFVVSSEIDLDTKMLLSDQKIKCEGCLGESTPLVDFSSYTKFLPLHDLYQYSNFNNFQSAILVIDEKKRIHYGNDFAANLLGFSQKRLLTKNPFIYDLILFENTNLFCMKDGVVGYNNPTQIIESNYTTHNSESGTLQILILPDYTAPSFRKRWIIYLHNVSLEINLKDKYARELEDKSQAEKELDSVQKQRDELFKLATIDPMTGLKNYRAFKERFHLEFERARRHLYEFGIIILDIDFFKKFNDTYGHQQGDEVLRHVSKVLRRTWRAVDFIARYGGEEFVIILPQTDGIGVKIVLEKLRANIEESSVANIKNESELLRVTASLGGVSIKSEKLRPMEWGEDVFKYFVELMDKNLYLAKEHGRNCVVFSVWPTA